MQARNFLLWSVLAALWGSSFLAIGVAVKDIDPAPLVFARMAIAAPVLGCVLLLRGGGLNLGARGWIIAAIAGVSGNVLPFLLISYAEQEVNTGLAALIMGIAPIITLVAAPLVHFEESLTRLKVFGALAGFGGVAVLAAPDLSAGRIGGLLPELCLVAAACCYAFTALFSGDFPFLIPCKWLQPRSSLDCWRWGDTWLCSHRNLVCPLRRFRLWPRSFIWAGTDSARGLDLFLLDPAHRGRPAAASELCSSCDRHLAGDSCTWRTAWLDRLAGSWPHCFRCLSGDAAGQD
jgi:hypothetical protein